MFKYSLNKISIPHVDLLRRLGYVKNVTCLTNKIFFLIDDIIDLAKKLIEIKCSLAVVKLILNENSSIIFDNGYNINSYDVSKLLKGCSKIYGIVVTIGCSLENKVSDFIRKKDIVNAVILDAAGSVAIENIIANLNLQIEQYESSHNNIITKRYSPGYGDWIINKNKELLDWLEASKIGININKACQMNPEKSISAIIGVMKLK
jgi:hypothetical protein